MESEIWKDIPEYKGIYQASSFGVIKSLPREVLIKGKYPIISKEIIMTPFKDINGYLMVSLTKNNIKKLIKVHQLVAMAFLGHERCGHKIVVDHIDNDKLNNNLSNLQLITSRENTCKDIKIGTSKYIGVSMSKNKKWIAQIVFNKKVISLGVFDSEIGASEYYQNALKAIENGEEIVVKKAVYSSKYRGIVFNQKYQKWKAFASVNNTRKYIGIFNTEEEAFNFQQKYLLSINNGEELPIKTRSEYSSKYRGVSWYKPRGKWVSHIMINYKTNFLGYYNNEEEAYLAYKNALKLRIYE